MRTTTTVMVKWMKNHNDFCAEATENTRRCMRTSYVTRVFVRTSHARSEERSADSGDRKLASALTPTHLPTNTPARRDNIYYTLHIRTHGGGGGGARRKWCRNEFCARRVFRSFSIQDGVYAITIIYNIYLCVRGRACVVV